MTFATGTSTALGNFSRSKSMADRGADPGVLSEITYQYRPAKSAFGFVAGARLMITSLKNSYPVYGSGYGNQPFPSSTGTQISAPTKSEGRIDDPNNFPGHSVKLDQANFIAGAVLAGISHHVEFSKRWSLQEELQLGIAKVTLGKSTLKASKADTANPGSADFVYSQWENTTDIGLTGLIKLGPSFHLNKTVSFFLVADYWFIHSKMTYTAQTWSGNAPSAVVASSSPPETGVNSTISTYVQTGVMKNPSMLDIFFGIRVALN